MIYANYILNKIKCLPKAVFASGFPLKLKSKFKRNALNYTIHGKTVTGKNLIPYPYVSTTKTVNGITFTDNGDGTITVNGTATANTNFQCSNLSSISMPQGNYILSSGVPDDDAKNAVGLAFGYKIGDESRTVLYTIGGQRTFTLNETAMCDVIIVIRANQTVNNIVFKPMLELGDTATEYEKYTVYGVGDKTKNLLPYPYANTTKTVNGVTFTDNGDGSITVNGTATANATFYIKTTDKNFKPSSTTLYISGCPVGGSSNTYMISVNAYKQTESGHKYIAGASDTGNSAMLNLTNKDYSQLELPIIVFSGTTVNNIVFKPYLINLDDLNDADNILPYPYRETTLTRSGITFTDNCDGSITANGTATARAYFILQEGKWLLPGKYYLSGCPSGGSVKTYFVTGNGYAGGNDTGNGIVYSINTDAPQTNIVLIVDSGATVNNLIFKPKMIPLDYEPYGYKIPLVNRGKNLANCEGITSVTAKGLTIEYLKNEDCFLINGTVTSSGVWELKYLNTKINPGTYYSLSTKYVSGTIDKTNATTTTKYAVIYFGKNNTPGLSTNWLDCGLDMVNVAKENRVNDCNYITRMNFYIESGITFDNYKVKIQLELGSSATDYEPYRAPDTTNVYHTAPLKDGDSISYKADRLPELQMYKGENNITTDTTITPVSIDIRYLN